MEGVKGQCFICERRLTDHSTTPDGGEDQELETTVFVLRKVLHAPASLLENFLKGTPSDYGLGVCVDCRPLLAECRAVHEELCQVKRKWSRVTAKVVKKMKVSAGEADAEDVSGGDEDVRKQSRRFVLQHLHGVVNESSPLPSGQDGQRRPVSEETEEGEAETSTANHSVAQNDDRDAVQATVVAPAPPPKKAVIRRRDVPKQKMRPGVIKQRLASRKTKKSYDCLFCPAKRADSIALENHLRVHTRERPIWCTICGKEVTTKSRLHQHQLVHSGEKPHECNLCQKRFSLCGNLNRHLRGHLGEKPFKCPDCGKAFLQRSSLTRHRVVHTGEKPFRCDVCGKCFSQVSSLSKHKKRHHSAVVKGKPRK